jgi:hypothetical protein
MNNQSEAEKDEPTCKPCLQVWVIPNGKGHGQFSWNPQDERFWIRMQPAATIKESLTVQHPQPRKPLTLKQMAKAFTKAGLNPDIQNDELSVARAIEAAHNIKE